MAVYGPYRTKKSAEEHLKRLRRQGLGHGLPSKESKAKIVPKTVYYIGVGYFAEHPNKI